MVNTLHTIIDTMRSNSLRLHIFLNKNALLFKVVSLKALLNQPCKHTNIQTFFVKSTVLKWAKVIYSFALIIVASLNLLPFNAILSFGTKKEVTRHLGSD